MTTLPSQPAPPDSDAPAKPAPRRNKWLNKSKTYVFLYALLLPTLLSMGVFGYYPKVDVLFKSVYRWTPGSILEYVGSKNYLDAFADPIFWQSFKVVAIMLVANLFKMWPGIIVAIALHRLLSDRWRYIYQVCFVIPMVVPMMVWLLVWKSFFDPDFGILNKLLNLTGVMPILGWMDGTNVPQQAEAVTSVTAAGTTVVETVEYETYTGAMPIIAGWLDPILNGFYRVNEIGQPILYETANGLQPQLIFPGIQQIFGGVWAMMLVGGVCLTLMAQRLDHKQRWVGYGLVLLMAGLMPWLAVNALGSMAGAILSLAIFIGLIIGMARTLGAGWVIWPFLLLYGIWACHGEPVWRLPVMMGAAIGFSELVSAKTSRLIGPEILRWVGILLLTVGGLMICFGLIWTEPTNQFTGGRPAWLGNQDLILPALILWGFPWVGTVGVLIYLAGLQQISTDVYEAAQLDGVGPIGKLFKIELPLIMTQVRINLIMMTIGTLTGYEFYFILLGPEGGPGNVGMVPGLYMFKSAFFDMRYGYACALGMVLFVVILLLTIVYQKYVKVDK
ncbi:carbohydrate ABC transporter permease [Algisphaera agarilytica]|uniref:ABC-type sugar transport system permease subunit n=1 Tax=Algisphaera agarilytica TaxID=1385975 RepID=A0A7X0H3E1_9BACT|nr:ABC transporter permease subunit [Algisphaera agarilytica]MBB6428558.1 ABC-type sugar transport system permease subunit [Algisphaera agarilytica]